MRASCVSIAMFLCALFIGVAFRGSFVSRSIIHAGNGGFSGAVFSYAWSVIRGHGNHTVSFIP